MWISSNFLTATSLELKLNRETLPLTEANYRDSGLGYGSTHFVNRKQNHQEIHVPPPNVIICAMNRIDAFQVGPVSLIYYRPQRSCGKVMFSQASVILSTGRGGVWQTHPGRHHHPGRHPLLGRYPQADPTPPGQTPPRQTPPSRQPLGSHPPGRHPQADTPLGRQPQADTPWVDTPRQTPPGQTLPRQTPPGQTESG